MKTEAPKDKTEYEELTELVSHLYAAFEDPGGWEVDGLLSDAAHKINKQRRMLTEAQRLIGEIRTVGAIIRETSRPSIISTDVNDRLMKIERQMMEWTGENPE